jgi:hypothetical protein
VVGDGSCTADEGERRSGSPVLSDGLSTEDKEDYTGGLEKASFTPLLREPTAGSDRFVLTDGTC